jgi:hypothetical protein
MCVIKDEIDHLKEKLAKVVNIFLLTRSDADTIQVIPDPARQKILDPTESGSTSLLGMSLVEQRQGLPIVISMMICHCP